MLHMPRQPQDSIRGRATGIWTNLPTMYNLPPWDELEQMKVAAIGDVFAPPESDESSDESD
jgi:hypothetical protein